MDRVTEATFDLNDGSGPASVTRDGVLFEALKAYEEELQSSPDTAKNRGRKFMVECMLLELQA